MSKSLNPLSDDNVYLSHDDTYIDFSSAGLYLVGLQTTVATVACAATTIAACWLISSSIVSAVRTLAITCAVGFLFLKNAIRVGRVRGVTTIFNALRPCVVIYILTLIIEQLVHTCVVEERHAPNLTRQLVFHSMIFLISSAGFWRAAKPTEESDGPFMVAVVAAVVIAMLPPQSSIMGGPFCESSTMFTAGERLLRSFLFSSLYVIHVYCSPPKRNSIQDLSVCVMRCAAAAVWVLGCHVFVLWVPIIQSIVALWARFGMEVPHNVYAGVDTRSDSGLSDVECGVPDIQLPRGPDGVLIAPYQRPSSRCPIFTPSAMCFNEIDTEPMTIQSQHLEIPVDPRELSTLVYSGQTTSKARMAEIAASLEVN